MFKMTKLHAPFGSPETPLYEASYREGLFPVVNGQCNVRFPETRDRLLKLGYVEINEAIEKGAKTMSAKPKTKPKNK
jgi:hypothetical protein